MNEGYARGLKDALGVINSILSESAVKEGGNGDVLLDTTRKTFLAVYGGDPGDADELNLWRDRQVERFRERLGRDYPNPFYGIVYDSDSASLQRRKRILDYYGRPWQEGMEEADEIVVYFNNLGELVFEWRDTYRNTRGEFYVMGAAVDDLDARGISDETVEGAVAAEGGIPKKYRRFFYSLKK